MSKKWTFLRIEKEGVLEKYWVIDKVTSEEALFKACSDKEIEAECGAYSTARFLGIDCAVAEPADSADFDLPDVGITRQKGILSHNVKKLGYSYTRINDFYKPPAFEDQFYTDDDGIEWQIPYWNNVSVQTLLSDYPQLIKPVVEMLFLDCLINNKDRHGKNWEIMFKDGEVIGLMPLFDHNQSQDENDKHSICRVFWDDLQKDGLTHCEVLNKLSVVYPEIVGELIKKEKKQ